ncbi:hypothetical protein FBU59_004479 [Linderina macrospora]|uniref:Uncharacterized protein n=1 Tax=Linderina macrospora TaxID=4868 RepID=A0ACC1J5J1_9FUNG|nr:hypothetical protein FBU59_004479 [Linderina macrospora]
MVAAAASAASDPQQQLQMQSLGLRATTLTLAVPEQSAANDTQDDQAPQATGTENLTVGDPESIPSIGKFESIRALYEYRAESEEYDRVNSNKWREKMDSRRRQNWSRITAVYTRIQQLRHGDESEESLERAIQIATDEMAREGMTLTKYSQTVRKTINEARKSSRRAQDVADASPDGEEGIRLQPPTQPTQPTQQQQQQSLQMLIGHQTQQYQQQQQQRLPNPTGY